jgi:hypothetical protein
MGNRGGKGQNGNIQISEYFFSAHIGICHYSPGISLRSIHFGDKLAWSGNIVNTQSFQISNYELFGGVKKEGGVGGFVDWLPGDPGQVLPENTMRRFNADTSRVPGFRGWASIFLRNGRGGSGGFYWVANNPYPKMPSIRIRRPSIGLDSNLAMIGFNTPNGFHEGSNPAHIIYEALTNTEWGLGLNSNTGIDSTSFVVAATTLFNEGFGLSAIWRQQTSIEALISEVIDHIQAAYYLDPTTGLITLKLLRGGYSLNSLPEINPDNAVLSNFRRKLWGEIANEVVVTYTNPDTEEEATVSAQDLGSIAIQGGVISTSRNYYMIRDSALAQRVAERDLAAVSHPIADCWAELDRSLWNLTPGSVVRLNWPEHGIDGVAMRIIEISKGSSSSGKYRVKMQEDIFGLQQGNYGAPLYFGWTSGSIPPAPLTNVRTGSAPAFLAIRALKVPDASHIEYPDSVGLILASQSDIDQSSFDLYAPETAPNGGVVVSSLGTYTFVPGGVLTIPLVAEAQTTISAVAAYLGEAPAAGDLVIIGDVADDQAEIGLVQNSSFLVSRGVLDTVPRYWPIGTRIWIVKPNASPYDVVVRSVGETVSYRLLTRTSQGLLPIESAPIESTLMNDRALRPLRPADVKLNGVGFGLFSVLGLSTVSVTWANRNRVVEATQVLPWTDATVGGEAGQVSVVQILDDVGAVYWQSADQTGTSYTLSISAFGSLKAASVRVISKRSGYTSLQGHSIAITGLSDRLALSGSESGLLLLSGDQAPGALIIKE